MPTYAYRGDQCGHEFEVRQSFSDDPVAACLTCGQPVHRVIHPAGIVFKGSGWYITDSRPTKDTNGGAKDAAKVSEKTTDTPAPASADAKASESQAAVPSPAASTTATAAKAS